MEECRIIFPAPGRAELEKVPSDSRPLGADEIAGRTLATLVSPGTELAIYQGRYAGAKFPLAPGYAAVFEVRAVGAEVKDLAPGERAFCMGPHRSFQRIRRGEAIVVPPGLAAESAVFARMIGVSMTTLATTRARPPAKVLVTGLGLVGHLAARVFALCGYDVVACDPDASRRALAEGKGIRVLPAVPLDDPELAGKIELVVECSGHEQAVLDACRAVARGGEVVLVGVPWARCTDLSAHDLLHAVFHNYVLLRSGWEWELPLHPGEFRPRSIFGNLQAAMDWLARGQINVANLAQRRSPRQAEQTYPDLLQRRVEALTVLFDWSDVS